MSGGPLRPLVLRGGPAELGQAHGAALAAAIREYTAPPEVMLARARSALW